MIKRNIPNAITCANLLCGCLAIVQAFEGNLVWASYLIGIAAVLDFLDGFAARMLGVTSPIGKDLDSLADMVTFGLVPGVIMFKLIAVSNIVMVESLDLGAGIMPPADMKSKSYPEWIKYIAFFIPIFSAIRLAKFNNDARQTTSFVGLPTPANALLIASFPLIVLQYSMNDTVFPVGAFTAGNEPYILRLLSNAITLSVVCVLLSFLLVAPITLFSLKFKSFSWADNKIRYIFLLLSMVLLAALQFVGIPLVIVLYVILSVVNNFTAKTLH